MRTWLRLTLLTLTIGGGFTGIAMTLQILVSPQVTGAAVTAICIVFLGLHTFVLVSGLLFAQNPSRVMPLVVACTLQIPWISSPIVAYRFADGVAGYLGVGEMGFAAWYRVGSDWQFNLVQPLPWGVGINVFAVVVLIALARSLRSQSNPGTARAAE